MTNKQRISQLFGKLHSEFVRKWNADKGLAGNSKDTRTFCAEKNGKTYLIVERSHKGASGKFSTTSVHVLNEEAKELEFVKVADSYELAKLDPEKSQT